MVFVCILNLRFFWLFLLIGFVDVILYVLFCIYKLFVVVLYLIVVYGMQVYWLVKFVVFEKFCLVDVIVVCFGKDFVEIF